VTELEPPAPPVLDELKALLGRADLSPEVRLLAMTLYLHGPLKPPALRKMSGVSDAEMVAVLHEGRLRKVWGKLEGGEYALREVMR
jgi:hypothetical protein